MTSNIKQFSLDLKRFGNVVVPEAHNSIVRKLSLEILRRIVLKTPVDTGRARGNWMVAINSVPQGIVKIDKLGKSQATDFALNNGIPVINSTKQFNSISVANNLPYIGVLEFGGSKQAPQGMVRVTIAEIQSIFR